MDIYTLADDKTTKHDEQNFKLEIESCWHPARNSSVESTSDGGIVLAPLISAKECHPSHGSSSECLLHRTERRLLRGAFAAVRTLSVAVFVLQDSDFLLVVPFGEVLSIRLAVLPVGVALLAHRTLAVCQVGSGLVFSSVRSGRAGPLVLLRGGSSSRRVSSPLEGSRPRVMDRTLSDTGFDIVTNAAGETRVHFDGSVDERVLRGRYNLSCVEAEGRYAFPTNLCGWWWGGRRLSSRCFTFSWP